MLIGVGVPCANAQEAKYPPVSEYMMAGDAEIALAKSAAPQNISDRATIEVFTPSGYQVAHQGDNGFVCMVRGGFTGAPTRTPIQLRGLFYDPTTMAPLCSQPHPPTPQPPHYKRTPHLSP